MLAYLQLLIFALAPVIGEPAQTSSTPAAKRPQARKSARRSLHAGWDRLLKKYVTEGGWVDYRRLQARDGAELKAYLKQLAGTNVAELGSRNAQKAFWINAYNAICVQTLIDQKLPEEVPHAFFFGTNIFKLETYKVAGKIRSLDEIEHEILRKRFTDSRIHAVVVCGASSCPRLRPEAFDGARLEAQLDEEARRWISVGKDLKGKRKNYLDRGRKIFYASKILDWYMEDFGDNVAGVRKFIQRYADPQVRQFMTANKVRIKYLDYDWRLNKQ